MGQFMVKCFTMTSCMFTKIQTTCGDRLNLRCGCVMADRHTSAEWYHFSGCNVMVVTTFRIGLLLFPLLFIAITTTQ
jgi:hypothetical protein